MTDKQKLYEKMLAAQWQEWNAQIARFKIKSDRATAKLKVNDPPPEDSCRNPDSSPKKK